MAQHVRALAQRFSADSPLIIQAPMAGGITSPGLVAAVSNANGIGSFATGYLTSSAVLQGIQEIKRLTNNPFAVNVFIPNAPELDVHQIQRYQEALNKFRRLLHLSEEHHLPTTLIPDDNFQEIIDILLEERVDIASFTFGNLPSEMIQAFKANGTFLIGTATSLEEALFLEEAGIDAIVLQGHEAGGHRGGFLSEANHASIGAMALIPQVARQVEIPLIAAGGIMDGPGIIAALVLGASAVQMGTAFLTTKESTANPAYKKHLLEMKRSGTDPTVLTSVYSGKLARGIRTPFVEYMDDMVLSIPPYPIPNTLSRLLRKEAAKQGMLDCMSMWSGQGVSLIREPLSVSDLIKQLHFEVKQALTALNQSLI